VPTYESSMVIAAPVEAVWLVLTDVMQWPQWLPTVERIEALDQKTLHVGSRFVIHQPKLRPVTWTVSEIEEPRRFAWVARSPGLHMVAEHSVTPDSPASTRLVLRFTFAGLLGGIIGRLFSSITKSYLAREAASLKQRVESPR